MKALYHQHAREPQEFDAKKNDDGTFDLSRAGEVVISKCPVSDDGLAGTCTLIKPAKTHLDPEHGHPGQRGQDRRVGQ